MTPVDPKEMMSLEPIIEDELENENRNGKDRHTIIDEITDNIIKVMIVAFAFIGFGYCMVTYVGKDKGVDPNLAYGFFVGLISSIVPAYFIVSRSKKEKTNGG